MQIQHSRPDPLLLFPTNQGGRNGPTPPDELDCLFEFEGEHFYCRLIFGYVGSLSPGENAEVRIAFLYPNLIKERLKPESRFFLKEVRVIGEGKVRSIIQDAK